MMKAATGHVFPAWCFPAFYEPVRTWNREAEEDGVSRRVFVLSTTDIFNDDNKKFTDEARARFWKLVRETPWLDWMLVTKHPENAASLWHMAALSAQGWDMKNDAPAWLPNVWLGAVVEDQKSANERVPHLARVPAAVRFLLCEPLLGEVLLHRWLAGGEPCPVGAVDWGLGEVANFVDWVLAGGESGPGARPCDLAWLRSLRDQCKGAGVPFFTLQLGARPEMSPGPIAWPCSDPNGSDPSEWPEDLRVREVLSGVRE